MSCCGKSITARGRGVSLPDASRAATIYPSLVTHFRCTGHSTVVAVGPATGRTYRFPSSGLTVQVDSRDATSLSRVRNVEQVRPSNQNSRRPPQG
jgi:hypothetical protein